MEIIINFYKENQAVINPLLAGLVYEIIANNSKWKSNSVCQLILNSLIKLKNKK